MDVPEAPLSEEKEARERQHDKVPGLSWDQVGTKSRASPNTRKYRYRTEYYRVDGYR